MRRRRFDALAACIMTGVKADGVTIFDLKQISKEKPPPKPPRPPRAVPRVRVSKYDAACCKARVDEIGRWPVGYCSETCERRP